MEEANAVAVAAQAAQQSDFALFVGNAFVQHYYHVLLHSPELVHGFYQDTSVIGRPEEDGSLSVTKTMQAIKDKIASLNYGDLRAEINSVDALESLDGGIHVLVAGYLTGPENIAEHFTQSFFLAPQDKGYFVLSDMFRFVDNVVNSASDSDDEVPHVPEPSDQPVSELRLSQEVSMGAQKPSLDVVVFLAPEPSDQSVSALSLSHEVSVAPQIPTPAVAGSAFVLMYYHLLHQSPELVHRFYQDISRIGRPEENGSFTITTTMQAINDKIVSFNYGDLSADITSVDSLESLSGGVHILVTGCLTGKDTLAKNFTQSFFLAPQDNGYFVLSDMFRYVDDVIVNSAPAIDDVVLLAPEPIPASVEDNHLSEKSTASAELSREKVFSLLLLLCIPIVCAYLCWLVEM